jgi:hypothetical protein
VDCGPADHPSIQVPDPRRECSCEIKLYSLRADVIKEIEHVIAAEWLSEADAVERVQGRQRRERWSLDRLTKVQEKARKSEKAGEGEGWYGGGDEHRGLPIEDLVSSFKTMDNCSVPFSIAILLSTPANAAGINSSLPMSKALNP